MSAQLDALRNKVQRILADEFGTIEVDKDGDFTLRHQSARVFVRCVDWGDDETIVSVFAPILEGVPATPELFRWIAIEGSTYFFGHMSATEADDGIRVGFSHTLLGDYLDAKELITAVVGVLSTGNDLDDEMQTKFGGRRFHEDG